MPNSFSIANALAKFNIHCQEVAAADLVNDSRQVKDGDIFCAAIGSAGDGRKFIDSAVKAGASLIIAQCHHQQQHGNKIKRSLELDSGDARCVDIIQFYQLDQKLFELASHYYQNPQQALTIVGITGTNGKTSTSQFIASLLEQCGNSSAVIGTTGAGKLNALKPIVNTTPGPTELNQLMTSFVADGVSHVAMEVSSHALDQGRISAEQLSVAVFTNLTRDHLDYHHTMEQYAEAKFAVFSGGKNQIAVINGDDEIGKQWLERLNETGHITIAYGSSKLIKQAARFVFAEKITLSAQGMTFEIETESEKAQVSTQLLGRFNVENLLAAIAALLALDIPLNQIIGAIPHLSPSQGRMETFKAQGKALAVVDYAHTPDALANAIDACREHCSGELWVVFGCGGDRDKGKRAEMGEIAERLADHIVVTNDNPRSEAPELIVNDILAGCTSNEKITVMLDRTTAVRSTLSHAKANDVVLMAGKGHENTIEIAGKITEYNERALVKSLYMAEERQ